MAHRIKAKDGACCECAQRRTPCECCGGGDQVLWIEVPNTLGWETHAGNLRRADTGAALPDTLECSNRGGTVTLIGFSEYADAAAPPKKYRVQTWSGVLSAGSGSFGPCYGGPWVFSGADVYDAATGALTLGGRCNTSLVGSANPDRTPDCVDWVGFCSGTYFTLAITATTHVRTVHGACANCTSASGSLGLELSEEDTVDDAFARLFAGPGGVWSDWTLVGPPPLCASATCCRAVYGVRTSGFSFPYREARWRVTPTGVTLGAGCHPLKVTYYRRAAGSSDPWVEWAEGMVDVIVDDAGNAMMVQ